ncbi:formate dehydrogenase%2C nitrate-inducible%2C iron-sulfur subunit [Shigella sonnei]|nr:formate dehydrogenase%2C nitrate-inducible%2C iron-sulfur subunit [Shigella sonnei]
MAMETQDIIKRSATNSITPPSQVRDYKAEVAKLIDVIQTLSRTRLRESLKTTPKHWVKPISSRMSEPPIV